MFVCNRGNTIRQAPANKRKLCHSVTISYESNLWLELNNFQLGSVCELFFSRYLCVFEQKLHFWILLTDQIQNPRKTEQTWIKSKKDLKEKKWFTLRNQESGKYLTSEDDILTVNGEIHIIQCSQNKVLSSFWPKLLVNPGLYYKTCGGPPRAPLEIEEAFSVLIIKFCIYKWFKPKDHEGFPSVHSSKVHSASIIRLF